MDLKTGAGKGNMGPASVANLQLADIPSSSMGSEGIDSDLGEPPQLQAEVASFLRGLSKMTEEESKEISLEPPISQPAKWVQWKAKRCDVPTGG